MQHSQITYVYLETTNYCNLECSFCNRDKVVKNPIHMSLNNWDLVLDKLKDQPIKEDKLMGLGEPFMHPQFSTICSKFKDYFPKAKVIVATNAQYKLNKNFEDSLKHIDLLYISIDGYKESYEKFRPPAKWEKLIKFLEDLQSVERYNCSITCNYVVNTQNVKDIEKINQLCKKYKLEELRLNLAQEWSENKNLTSNASTWGYAKEDMELLKKNFKDNVKGKSPWTWSDCFWIENGLYMTVNGDLKICCLNTDTESIGNIFNNSLEDIFNSKKINDVRVGCKNNKPTSHCKNCSYKELSPLIGEIRNN